MNVASVIVDVAAKQTDRAFDYAYSRQMERNYCSGYASCRSVWS